MSGLGKLEQAIKNRPITMVIHPASVQLQKLYDSRWRELQILFDAFKKDFVVVPRKQLQDRFNEVIDNLVEHDVCCIHCLEKGQAMELQKLLGVGEKQSDDLFPERHALSDAVIQRRLREQQK